jgi:hypothetical protein
VYTQIHKIFLLQIYTQQFTEIYAGSRKRKRREGGEKKAGEREREREREKKVGGWDEPAFPRCCV